MAIRKILTDEDPILRKKSREVDCITPRIKCLITDMIETLKKAEGAGLAAVQVGVLKRVVIIDTEEDKTTVLVNPVLISAEGTQTTVEGCLSVPEKWGMTERPSTVTIKAQNENGEEVTITGTDLTAKAICHELDHLEGILYTDKVTKMLTREEVDKLNEKDDGGEKNES